MVMVCVLFWFAGARPRLAFRLRITRFTLFELTVLPLLLFAHEITRNSKFCKKVASTAEQGRQAGLLRVGRILKL